MLFVVDAVYGDHGLIHVLQPASRSSRSWSTAPSTCSSATSICASTQRLQSDDRYIEKQARERLGLVKKGELDLPRSTAGRRGGCALAPLTSALIAPHHRRVFVGGHQLARFLLAALRQADLRSLAIDADPEMLLGESERAAETSCVLRARHGVVT